MKITNEIKAMDLHVLGSFLLTHKVLNPLEKIIFKLEHRGYRDCDFNFLKDKLRQYSQLAFDFLNIKINLEDPIDGIMNDHTRGLFLKYFKILYKLFNSYK